MRIPSPVPRIANAGAATIACAISTLAVILSPALAQDRQDVPFGKHRNWAISSVHDTKGFNHCAGRVNYKDGIKLGLLGYFDGNWALQFDRESWDERREISFDVRIEIDGRPLLNSQGKWIGRSAFIHLGKSDEYRAALMNGSLMTVITAAGSTQFRLDGSAAATRMIASCREQQLAAKGPTAKHKTANNGAFGPTAGRTPVLKLTRADSLPYAYDYLTRRRIMVDLIDESANILKHFPVNWRTGSGVVGGVMVLSGAGQTPSGTADHFFNEQRQLCKGSLSSHTRNKAQLPDGAVVELVSALCTGQSTSYSIVFQITSPRSGLVVIVAELAQYSKTPSWGPNRPAANEL